MYVLNCVSMYFSSHHVFMESVLFHISNLADGSGDYNIDSGEKRLVGFAASN